ncbi:DUF3139 domain-containing protein [Cytobacillus oceanisediminis]|uniref:DUF3139 domain-containing protein n=1 Tax=Cytobacillus oceanisediminis TaxID=665099 RepID=UPI002493D0CB|nr:DUF3139 domain-containing protein [Cytobacillus oceanisediminis]
MKKLLLIIAGLLILASPVLFLYVLNNGNPIMNKWITHEVKKHLDGTDYDESDFQEHSYSIPKMDINHDFYHTHYYVIFKDEPNINYYYGKKKWFGDVVQFCEKEDASTYEFVTGNTEHSEEVCVSMLDNR